MNMHEHNQYKVYNSFHFSVICLSFETYIHVHKSPGIEFTDMAKGHSAVVMNETPASMEQATKDFVHFWFQYLGLHNLKTGNKLDTMENFTWPNWSDAIKVDQSEELSLHSSQLVPSILFIKAVVSVERSVVRCYNTFKQKNRKCSLTHFT